MNFSIHLDERLIAALKRQAHKSGKTRNALITEAVREWLARAERATWPDELTDFEPFDELEPFESHRSRKRTGARF
jgi:hypothetical protein